MRPDLSITIPEGDAEMEPDMTPPPPTQDTPSHLRNMSRKRQVDSDDEGDGGFGVQPFSATWSHNDDTVDERSILQSPGVVVGQYVHLPSAPVCERLFRSVKRPRSQVSTPTTTGSSGHLASLLDGINLNQSAAAAATPMQPDQAMQREDCYYQGAGKAAADPVGRHSAVPFSSPHTQGRSYLPNPQSPSPPPSPLEGKRRRSIPGINGGAKIGEHLGGNRRSKQLRNSVEGLRSPLLERQRGLVQRESGRIGSPPGAAGGVPIADWPPWAGDAVLRGQEAMVADPKQCVREAMRASCREALRHGKGLALSASMPELVMAPATIDHLGGRGSLGGGGEFKRAGAGRSRDEDWAMVETAKLMVDNAVASFGPPEEDVEFLDAEEPPQEMFGGIYPDSADMFTAEL